MRLGYTLIDIRSPIKFLKIATTNEVKTFDSLSFFRAIKERMAKMVEGMSLAEKKTFMQEIKKVKLK